MTAVRRRRGLLLDRDGVLIEDVGLLTEPEQVRLIPGAAEALAASSEAGFVNCTVSNQTVIARGIADAESVDAVNARIDELLVESGGPPLDGHFYCPHHPEATLASYRVACECRKPETGLLRAAAAEFGFPLADSVMVGDRPTDIVAGREAGCRTMLVLSGRHADAPIVTAEPLPSDLRPDHTATTLHDGIDWILGLPVRAAASDGVAG